jgi:secreted trypsin-like serine protease
VAGYGSYNSHSESGRLRYLNSKVLSPNLSSTDFALPNTNKMGTRNGDSGGPVYLPSGKNLIVIGVTSTILQHSDKHYLPKPAIELLNKLPAGEDFSGHENVSSYVNWIRATIPEMEACGSSHVLSAGHTCKREGHIFFVDPLIQHDSDNHISGVSGSSSTNEVNGQAESNPGR